MRCFGAIEAVGCLPSCSGRNFWSNLVLCKTVAVCSLLVLGATAVAQVQPSLRASGTAGEAPVLTINGVTSADNSAVVHLIRQGPLEINLSGTPGHRFGLFLSGDADGAINNGFFLKVWEPDLTTDSPVHSVFDGIGIDLVAANLPGYTTADFWGGIPAPFFVFNGSGSFHLSGKVPSQAFLADTDPSGATGPDNPILIPLESSAGNTVHLFFQVVSLDPSGTDFRIGNGIEAIFDEQLYNGVVHYSEGQDFNLTSFTMGSKQTFGNLYDLDLSGGPVSPLDQTGSDFSSDGFPANMDVWMITLAGESEVIDASTPANAPLGTETNPDDPDTHYTDIHDYASGLEFLAGTRPERNNENREYPRISLPGNRELFHWRKGGSPVQYGFGVLFKGSGKFRNLMPTGTVGLPFTETDTRSPWEVEVGVSPDGNRALVVLDASSAGFDQIYLLNLEDNGVFGNGLPNMPVVPGGISSLFRRSFEESIAFVADGSGGWVGFIESTDSTSTDVGLYPNYLFRIDATNGSVFSVLPGGGHSISRLDRNTYVSDDRNALCVIGGNSSSDEEVYSITNVTRFSHALVAIAGFDSNTKLMESNDARDGRAGWGHLSKDGSLFAFARAEGADNYPLIARTNGADAGSLETPVKDISFGGLFDTDSDYPNCQELFLTDDNETLLFFQGLTVSGSNQDRLDLFSYNRSSGVIHNLTRTINGVDYTGAGSLAYSGPWDVPAGSVTTDRSRFDPGGSFLNPDRTQRYYFRALRSVAGQLDRLNLIAISQEASADFELTNVTGTELEPRWGSPPPSHGAPDVKLIVQSGVEQTAGGMRIRRIGGTGVLKDWYFMTALLSDAPTPVALMEQLFMFDGSHPGPALKLTHYGTAMSPFTVLNNSRIVNVTPSRSDAKVGYIVNNGGSIYVSTQALIVQDLGSYGTPVCVPNPGSVPVFNKSYAAGSLHWRKVLPSGLVYVRGTVVRPTGIGAGSTDGIATGIDVYNPIDASPYFFTFEKPTLETAITVAAGGANRRASFIWGVR